MSLTASNKGIREGQRPARGARLVLAGFSLVVLAGCSSHRTRPERPASPPPAPAPSARTSSPPPAASPPATPSPPAAGLTVAPRPEVPSAARADFDRAVHSMRSGNRLEAELGFKQVALQYPQFAAPLVNLAILQRRDGHLEEAEQTLKKAVAREPGSAVAWTELGATQRLRGEFKDASSSYQQAIAADPGYAPAWRNLGVLSDLYLGDPAGALKAFEQYRQLTGEDKPVSGWIAELRQRLGLAPVKRPAQSPAQPSPGGPAPEASPAAPPAETPGTPSRGGPQPGSGGTEEPQSEPAPAETVALALTGNNARRAGG